MRLNATTHLTYCLNVHPGESWDDQRQAIAGAACMVKASVSPNRPFGLGLRVGRRALDTLETPEARDDLRRLLNDRGLYVFTVNAFPYGVFHGQPVKAHVYAPNWSRRERLDYTLGVAEVLADLLPEGVEGSISTVPVAYKDGLVCVNLLARCCEHLADASYALHTIEERTGRLLHLGLEPEPDCLVENTPGSISFFENTLLPLGTAWLRRHQGLTAQAAEAILYRHVGICLDTCHLAVQFESPLESLQVLHRHGIRISKVQISAALQAETSQQAVYTLFPFARDEVYLHQVKVLQPDGTLQGWRDLTPERLTTWNSRTPHHPCRIHYHVPLDFAGYEGLTSTASLLSPDFYATARACGVTHFEIETYTFNVLPLELRQRTVVESIIAEFRQVLPNLS